MVEKSNFKKLEVELLKSIENLEIDGWNDELKHKLEDMKRAVAEGHQWIFSRIEDVDPVARLESFRTLKLSRLESFRVPKC